MILSSIWETIWNLMLSLLPECALIFPKFHEQVLKHKILLRSIGHVIISISIVITELVKNLVPVNSQWYILLKQNNYIAKSRLVKIKINIQLFSGISEPIYIWPKTNLKCLLGTHCQGVLTLEVRQCRCTWSR